MLDTRCLSISKCFKEDLIKSICVISAFTSYPSITIDLLHFAGNHGESFMVSGDKTNANSIMDCITSSNHSFD